MGKDLVVNGKEADGHVPKHADFYAEDRKMTCDEFRETINDLLKSGNMENWAFAGHLAILAADEFKDEPNLRDQFDLSEDSPDQPGESLDDFADILNVPERYWWDKLADDGMPLDKNFTKEQLKPIYEYYEFLYETAFKDFVKSLSSQTIVVDYC